MVLPLSRIWQHAKVYAHTLQSLNNCLHPGTKHPWEMLLGSCSVHWWVIFASQFFRRSIWPFSLLTTKNLFADETFLLGAGKSWELESFWKQSRAKMGKRDHYRLLQQVSHIIPHRQHSNYDWCSRTAEGSWQSWSSKSSPWAPSSSSSSWSGQRRGGSWVRWWKSWQ